MNAQLSFLELPGVTLTTRTLAIPSGVPDDALPKVGARLVAVRGCMKWALGQLLAEMLHRRPIKSKGRETGEYNPEWLNEFADAHDIDPKERREMMSVHLFYPPHTRTHELSYEHYREAMLGVCDGRPDPLQRALAYLDVAACHDWKHTELRRHIRSSQAEEKPDTTQSTFHGYSILYDFRRFIAKEFPHPEHIDPPRARILLDDLGEETLAFIDQLRTLARTP